MVTVDTLARLRAVQAASRDTYAQSVAADAADEIERLLARIAELEAAIAFADRQTEEGTYVVAFGENMK